MKARDDRSAGAPRTDYERLREELVVAHQGLVQRLAFSFVSSREPFDDLTQVGMLGLLKALDRFDPEHGAAFRAYASPVILGEIRHYLRDKSRSLRVPRSLGELHAKVLRTTEQLTHELGRSPMIDEIAERLDVSGEEVLEAQELGKSQGVVSLDESTGEGGSGSITVADAVLGRIEAGFERADDRAMLEAALDELPGRERIIIYLRFFRGMTQMEVAERIGLSQMQISRLQRAALERLHQKLASGLP